MNKELNIGEYVRTKYGITQYREYETTNGNKILCMPVKDGSSGIFANIEDIIKSSPNIIDLLELRDIVELFEEDDVDGEITGFYEVLAYTTDRKEIGVRNKDGEIDFYPAENLRGIITYEQIASMEYKIGE